MRGPIEASYGGGEADVLRLQALRAQMEREQREAAQERGLVDAPRGTFDGLEPRGSMTASRTGDTYNLTINIPVNASNVSTRDIEEAAIRAVRKGLDEAGRRGDVLMRTTSRRR